MLHNEYREYFKGLAESHVDIAHTDTHPRFFSYNSKDVADYAQNVEPGHAIMILSPFGGRFGDNAGDYRTDEMAGAFTISFKLAGKYPGQDDIDHAYDQSKLIMQEIFLRIDRDVEKGCVIHYFDLSRVTYEMIAYQDMPGMYGYIATFPIKTAFGAKYDPSRWQ